jgi:hypothetical protein
MISPGHANSAAGQCMSLRARRVKEVTRSLKGMAVLGTTEKSTALQRLCPVVEGLLPRLRVGRRGSW